MFKNDLLVCGFNTPSNIEDILYNTYNDKSVLDYERKFVDTIKVSDYQVETDDGFVDIINIGKTIYYQKWILKTKHFTLECADNHIVFDENFNETFIKNLKVGDKIWTKNGLEKVKQIFETNENVRMYDLQLDHKSNNRFYTNGILSHNSLWMQNLAVNIADNGGVVLYITLEMSSRKCMKRMGSMRMNIDIDRYDELSKDDVYMKKKLNEVKNTTGTADLFNSKPGKIYVKKYNTSDCTITDIDNYVKKFEERKRLKVNALIVDYIGIMSIEKGFDYSSMLYLKGKHLAEGLRRLADKHKCIVITATQTDKSVWGANDIKLENMPESKAIAESADTVWGIIRNAEMKKNNLYKLKILKFRDGEHHEEQIKFDLNPKTLKCENDTMLGSK